MTDKRPMNIPLLTKMAKQLVVEYKETPMISVDERHGCPCVQVQHYALADVANSDRWTWHETGYQPNSWRASVTVDGVLFIALFTDEEKAEVSE